VLQDLNTFNAFALVSEYVLIMEQINILVAQFMDCRAIIDDIGTQELL
jgi:hypothetical protein